jgi:hypothetical protein
MAKAAVDRTLAKMREKNLEKKKHGSLSTKIKILITVYQVHLFLMCSNIHTASLPMCF